MKTQNRFIAISLVKLNHSHIKYSRKKFYRRIFLKLMPCLTERQQAADTLHQAFLTNLIPEAEAHLYDESSDSEYGSDSDDSSESSEWDHSYSGSSLSSSSSSSDEPAMPTSEVMLGLMSQLYSKHYLNSQEVINKDSNQLYLLLYDHKINWPEIFQPTCTSPLIALMI